MTSFPLDNLIRSRINASIAKNIDINSSDDSESKVLTAINLSNLDLTEFPLSQLLPYKESLEFINLGGNCLSSLPLELEQFRRLRILFFAQNKFQSIPDVIGKLTSLYMLSFKSNQLEYVSENCLGPSIQWLILTDNRLSSLPKSIGTLISLKKLMLAGNRLTSLPDELRFCTELELLRLSVNMLESFPSSIFISLPKLSWLAYSGNPFCAKLSLNSSTPAIEKIPWSSLTVIKKLGEGASGDVFSVKRDLPDSEALNTLAIKIFKGEITSDGLAEDEIAITERIGSHPNFIPIKGRVMNHPDGKIVAAFPLLDSERYKVLGLPPSFDSITRDTFPHETVFSWDYSMNILRCVASACKHLHSCGIMHGDLYCHNILADSKGDAFLTDFGAASFKPFTVAFDAELLEKIEVRAFGCLIDDLLSRCASVVMGDKETEVTKLLILRDRCWDDSLSNRPLFSDILEFLQ